MVEHAELPRTVAPGWRPRSEGWLRHAPSRFDGVPDRPLFIGACPRSGTTLLRVLLDNHPDLAIPHETDFVRPLWWQRARFGDLRDGANRRRVAEWIFAEKRHRSARLHDGRVSRRDAIDRVAQAAPTIGSIVQACLQLRAEADVKPRWGDKRPSYSGFLGPLFAMFPHCQYINVVRDPRERWPRNSRWDGMRRRWRWRRRPRGGRRPSAARTSTRGACDLTRSSTSATRRS